MRLFTVDKAVHLWAHLAVALSIGLATARHFFTSPLFRVAAFVVFVATFSMTEMVLVAPLLLGLFSRLADEDASSRAERWLAFALPIVRIDVGLVALVAALVMFRRQRRRAVLLALTTLAGIAVQLVTMKLAFGHFLGVAASLKLAGSFGEPALNVRFNLGQSVFQTCLFGSFVLLAAIAVSLRRDRSTLALSLASLSFIAMHVVFSLVRGWYVVPTAFGILFVAEHATKGALSQRLSRATHAVAAVVSLVFAVRMVRTEIVYADDQRIAATFLAELRARVPADARVYTWDNPGFLGFFSERNVVDGDGLVNDHAYARRLGAGDLAGYLDEESICYVVVADAGEDPVLDVAGLVVRRADVEQLYVIRRKQSSQADFELHRIASERCAVH